MCYTPIRVKSRKKNKDGYVAEDGSYMTVPCGKCPKCKNRRANDWIFRLQQEEKRSDKAIFVTMTYDNESVPISKNGFLTLKKSDVQNFFKRLRQSINYRTIKYYLCGEYGGRTFRPHYHAIIFNVTEEECYNAWHLNGKLIGDIQFGKVEGASIAYTTKYICKEKQIPMHNRDDRVPEFSLMSKNIGLNYLVEPVKRWHTDNMASYTIQDGGYPMALPRYYREKIFTEEQKEVLFQKHQEQKSLQLQRAIKDAGSSQLFYKRQFEAIQVAKNFIKNNVKRNKI